MHPLGICIIAVANQKGGAQNHDHAQSCCGLAQRGKRVLIIDLDPQGGSGVSIGITTDALNKTVYNVRHDEEVGFSDILSKTKFGFDIAPSNIDLAGAETNFKQLLASEQVLKRKLEEILDNYDFNSGLIARQVLACSPSMLLTVAKKCLFRWRWRIWGMRRVHAKNYTMSKV